MNFLPLGLAGLAARGLASEAQEPQQREERGNDFSAMLRQPETPRMESTATPRPAAQKKPAGGQRDHTARDADGSDEPARGERTDRNRESAKTTSRDKPRDSRRDARDDGAGNAAAAASDAPTTAAVSADSTSDTTTAEAPEGTDAPWPPAGLGGLDLLLGGAPVAASPVLVDASGLAAGLPQADLPALPATATSPALPGPGAAPTAALVPASAGPVSDPAATASVASSLLGAAMTADDGATPGDTAGAAALPFSAHLAGINAPTAPRGVDAAVFDGSPTATPDLHGEDFDEAIGTRLSWLADQKIGHAHIKISPNDLGPVEVRLHLDGDKVNASFTAANADVRQALEQSLPRLRDMLGQHGFQLGNADVGQQAQGHQSGATAGNDDAQAGDEAGVGIPAGTLLRQRGLLDAYA